eukprot:GDKK01047607.1.p1 GENE.GDKK01047607.1~~GDKK01047607.1.p1  ORF type:complete len:218 (-),score=15.64 GDKK01047607.1:21-674(-)
MFSIFSGGCAGDLLEGVLMCFNADGSRCDISCASMVRACLVPEAAIKSTVMKADKVDNCKLEPDIELSRLAKRVLSSSVSVTHFSITSGSLDVFDNPQNKWGADGCFDLLNSEPGGIQNDITSSFISVKVSDLGPGRVGLSTRVISAGEYRLFVQLLGIDIGGTPCICQIKAGPPDASRCKLSGRALTEATVTVLPPARRTCKIFDEETIIHVKFDI